MQRRKMVKSMLILLSFVVLFGGVSTTHVAQRSGVAEVGARSTTRLQRQDWPHAVPLPLALSLQDSLRSRSLGTSLAAAEGAMQWNRTYGGTNNDTAWSVIQTPDDGFILAGETHIYSYDFYNNDAWLGKTNARGEMEWEQTYGFWRNDNALTVIQTVDGGFALTGRRGDWWGGRGGWLVKTDMYGNVEWDTQYYGHSDELFHDVIQTADGSFMLVGCINTDEDNQDDFIFEKNYPDGNGYWNLITEPSGAGGYDVWLAKIHTTGTMEWMRTYGGSGDDSAVSIIQTTDGGFALYGETNSIGAGDKDAWLVKTDASGNEQWKQTYGGPAGDHGRTAIQTIDGGFALVGDTDGSSWLVKTDAAGNTEWNQTYGSSNHDQIYSVIQMAAGGFFLIGHTSSYGAGNLDGWLVKINARGTVEGTQTFGGSGHDYFHDGIQTVDGSLALAGGTNPYGTGSTDIWLVKTLSATVDTDSDGFYDLEEAITYGTDFRDPDTDDDGLDDGEEVNEYSTDPLDDDTDNDGLLDGGEVTTYRTNPTVVDTDGDRLSDGEEVTTYGTNPTVADTDGDRLSDGEEVATYGTNPTMVDTDEDGLTDREEITTYDTDPLVVDTDGDEFSDGEEVDAGFDPNDPTEYPSLPLLTPPPFPPTTVTIEPPAFFIPGFGLVEGVLVLICLVVLVRRTTKR